MPLLFVLLFFSAVASVSAQPDMLWESEFQPEKFTSGKFYDLVPTEDGVVTFGSGRIDNDLYWVAGEYDSDGFIVRDNTFPYHRVYPGMNAINANGNGYIVCARNFAMKIDDELNTVWSAELEGDYVEMRDVMAVDDGYILVGELFDTVAHSSHAGIIKLNEDGEEEWRRLHDCWGGINSISQTEEGDIYIGGVGNVFYPGASGYILQINAEGDSLRYLMGAESYRLQKLNAVDSYVLTYGGNNMIAFSYEDGSNVLQHSYRIHNVYPDNTDYSVVDFYWLPEGGGIATGYVAFDMDYVDDVPADYHLFLIRYSPDYEPVWHIEQPSNWEFWVGGESVVPGTENSYYFCGQIDGMFYLARTEPDPYSVDYPSQPQPCGTFCLNPAYPNPFNGSTMVAIELNKSKQVDLSVFDNTGRLIYQSNQFCNPGKNLVHLNLSELPSGLYHLQAMSEKTIKHVELIKLK